MSIDPEQFLLERLKDHGVDVYAPAGPFECLRDRLAQVIVDNRFGSVVAGRHNGKPERYEDLFQRIYGTKLPAQKREAVQS